jgi:hypothetical protein
MFAPLINGIRADIDQQIDWAKGEIRRQTRYTVLIGMLAVTAALAVLGAIIVGLVALYFWLTPQVSPLTALGGITGGLLLLALVLLPPVYVWGRPRVAARPPLQIALPAALFGSLRQSSYEKMIVGGDQTLKLATSTVRHGSRPALLGTLFLALMLGLIAGRTL